MLKICGQSFFSALILALAGWVHEPGISSLVCVDYYIDEGCSMHCLKGKEKSHSDPDIIFLFFFSFLFYYILFLPIYSKLP